MTSYRESSFDPNAFATQGGPKRPFNWVQWLGVAVIAVGTILAFAFLLSKAGVVSKRFTPSPQPFILLPQIGMLLVNSRRIPGAQVEEHQRRRNQRVLLITTAIVAPILIAAAAIDYLGAH